MDNCLAQILTELVRLTAENQALRERLEDLTEQEKKADVRETQDSE